MMQNKEMKQMTEQERTMRRDLLKDAIRKTATELEGLKRELKELEGVGVRYAIAEYHEDVRTGGMDGWYTMEDQAVDVLNNLNKLGNGYTYKLVTQSGDLPSLRDMKMHGSLFASSKEQASEEI